MGRGRKKTQHEFEQEVLNIAGSDYSVLGEYIDNKTKIKILHLTCQTEFDMLPSNFLQGQRCPLCGKLKAIKSKTKTNDKFVKEVFDLVGDKYKAIGEYKGALCNIEMMHVECGNVYSVRPRHFLDGVQCPRCFKDVLKTTEQFKDEFSKVAGDDYLLISEYKGCRNKIKVLHVECQTEYEVSPLDFIKGRRCYKCSGKMKKNTEIFKQEVFECVGNDYKVLGEYINNRIKIKMLHPECDTEYYVTPHNFMFGTS